MSKNLPALIIQPDNGETIEPEIVADTIFSRMSFHLKPVGTLAKSTPFGTRFFTIRYERDPVTNTLRPIKKKPAKTG